MLLLLQMILMLAIMACLFSAAFDVPAHKWTKLDRMGLLCLGMALWAFKQFLLMLT